MRIKKREVLFSVIIVLVMIFIGIFVSDAILQGAVSKSESYRTATVIENTDQFYYGMDTNFGNVLVYGDVSSNSSEPLPKRIATERNAPRLRFITHGIMFGVIAGM